MMKAGKLDAIALSRESVGGLVDALPGSRVLEEAFLNSTTAVAVPQNKPAARAFVTAFIEEAKASGLVRRALDAMGLEDVAGRAGRDESLSDGEATCSSGSGQLSQFRHPCGDDRAHRGHDAPHRNAHASSRHLRAPDRAAHGLGHRS